MVLALSTASIAANASVFKVDFHATSFSPRLPTTATAPVSSVSGNFTYRTNAHHDVIEEILGVSLNLNGYEFAAQDVGSAKSSSQLLIGGTRTGVNGLMPGTHDFLFIFDAAHKYRAHFWFITAGAPDLWRSGTVNYDVAEVPEPASVVLMLGLLGAAAAARRRQGKSDGL